MSTSVVPKGHTECDLGPALVKLPSVSAPVIAVDLDDVLSQTNHTLAEWHNEAFGTKMDISMFYYYYYWKNPFWGSPTETFKKVTAFYATDRIHNASPVPGSREGVQILRDMGFRLIIVTARAQDDSNDSWSWVNKHYPGLFDGMVYTGQFKDFHKDGFAVVTKLSKAEMCRNINAQLLIDDSAENALSCATAYPPTRVLLFGDYEWNKRCSGLSDSKDEMTFDKRLEAEGGREFWKDERLEVPEGTPLERVQDWGEVVKWIREARLDGRI